jgi:hypothetical protein
MTKKLTISNPDTLANLPLLAAAFEEEGPEAVINGVVRTMIRRLRSRATPDE